MATWEPVVNELIESNSIDAPWYDTVDVKRGLRNADGSGVIAGLSRISSVLGTKKTDSGVIPVDGELNYRGIPIQNVLDRHLVRSRYFFEEAAFFLLVGRYPTDSELTDVCLYMDQNRLLPDEVQTHLIRGVRSANVMNRLSTVVSGLYGCDSTPDSFEPEENFLKSLRLLAKMPSMIVYSFFEACQPQAKWVQPESGMSVAESFLYLLGEGKVASDTAVKTLDSCLVLHAEHGGGNNSTFATRVVTSTESDFYASMVAALGSLKGPLHGSANKKVMEMMADIIQAVGLTPSEEVLNAYLRRLLLKDGFDHSGKLYGLGHAVYTKSDPRAGILIEYAKQLSKECNRHDELQLYFSVAHWGPILFSELKGPNKLIAPNIDFYSGFVYDCLGIPEPLYTPMFALGRLVGWCAHRMEEMIAGKRIIRPGYKYVATRSPVIK